MNEISYILTLLTAVFLFTQPQLAYALISPGDQDPEKKPEEKPWEKLLMFKKGGSSAPSPDPNIGLAAMKQAELGEEWLNFAKDQFNVSNERQKQQDVLANQVTQQQLDASKQAQQWATEDRDRYNNTFKPLEDQFIDKAQNWDSAERQQQQASEAKADVLNNASQQRQATERNMASMGVNPTSGRYAGVERSGENATALAAAGAENNARNTVRNQALSLQADAVNMGKGLAVNPASSLGLSTSAGSAAMQTTAGNNAQAAGLSSIMGQGYQAAMTGYGNQANTLNQQYQNQLNAWQANQLQSNSLWGGLGQFGGMLGGAAIMSSSKDYKENKRPAKGSLEAVRRMPVEEWKYKDGIEDGGQHIGAYAEDFHAATGKGDGKSIPVVDAIGITMGAIQDLDKKVDALAKGRGLPQRKKEVA
ncbi:tail fiber domain-containing protein [Klebsiella phage SJM3]|uniref:Tail fiber domain-containing protein n=1 Tax=Klebsiella phage SJM3 TaxID=2723759 RepID=A0A6H0X3Q5_9CAUD|nr:tail fiber domain-containing protein [Klebsiella phage SJM3]